MAHHEFKAMLRFWRRQRGFSQLSLALAAGVSARHLSFLETGRAKPTLETLKRVLEPMSLQLRDYGDVMRTAGFGDEILPHGTSALPESVELSLVQMMERHQPFPLVVLSGDYRILRTNKGADCLFEAFSLRKKKRNLETTIIDLVFDPYLIRPFIKNWHDVAHYMLARLSRECISRPKDRRLQELKKRALGYPKIEKSWGDPDFDQSVEAALAVCLERNDLVANFLLTVTAFSAPTSSAADELRIETYFPADSLTADLCRRISDPLAI